MQVSEVIIVTKTLYLIWYTPVGISFLKKSKVYYPLLYVLMQIC